MGRGFLIVRNTSKINYSRRESSRELLMLRTPFKSGAQTTASKTPATIEAEARVGPSCYICGLFFRAELLYCRTGGCTNDGMWRIYEAINRVYKEETCTGVVLEAHKSYNNDSHQTEIEYEGPRNRPN